MRKFLLSAFVLLFTPSVFAFSGNDLLQRLIKHQQVTEGRSFPADELVAASVSAAFGLGFVAGIFYILEDIDPKVCLPNQGGNNSQYAAVTKRYLDNNPNQLHRPAQALVREAAIQAFPCKR
jgi:hypothetical protein